MKLIYQSSGLQFLGEGGEEDRLQEHVLEMTGKSSTVVVLLQFYYISKGTYMNQN